MVEDLIRRARRRFVFNEALGQFAFGASVAVAGLTLLLILGTRYLEWWTLALIAGAGFGFGAWRVFRRVPGRYAMAVCLDQTGGLSDAPSTSLYFSHRAAADAEFQRRQRELAEAASTGIELDRAVPFTFPKTLYAIAA